MFAEWPIVHTREGFCCTLKHAAQRKTLHLAFFTAEEAKLLQYFGCLFTTATDFNADRRAADAELYTPNELKRKVIKSYVGGCLSLRGCGDAMVAVADSISLGGLARHDGTAGPACPEYVQLKKLVCRWASERQATQQRKTDHAAGDADDGVPPSWAHEEIFADNHAATDTRSRLRELPIFEAIGQTGLFAVRSSTQQMFIAPCNTTNKSGVSSSGQYDEVSSWDTALQDAVSEMAQQKPGLRAGSSPEQTKQFVLSFQGAVNQQLARLARASRPSLHQFVQHYATVYADSGWICQSLADKLIDSCATVLDGKAVKGASIITAGLKKLRLVFAPGTERSFLCSQCTDPTDTLLSDILSNSTGVFFPPAKYHNDRVLMVLRSAGLQTLKQPQTFIMAATEAAHRQNLASANASSVHGGSIV